MPTHSTPPPVAEQDTAPGIAGAPSPAVVRALRKVLRPLVHLMLSRGITYPYLSDMLKGLFVEVADRDFRLDDKPPTDSRISLISGVHRKDVSRLRQLLHGELANAGVADRQVFSACFQLDRRLAGLP